ncbi:hypothetical protein [Streptomyces sp. KAI-27]|uniref:hypothetical protein n=1 Tax=Streptomyces TaxID=1883 RepID=UPI0038D1C7D6
MTVDVATRPPVAVRRARVAVAVLFFTNGALFANLLPRIRRSRRPSASGTRGTGWP